jgi:hypothetical protein
VAGFLLSQASGILREVLLPEIREQLNQASDTLKLIERRTDVVEGSEAVLSLHVSRSAGIGARLEDEASPNAARQGYVKARVPLRTNEGRIEITVQSMRAMRSSKSAQETPFVSESKRIVLDLRRDINRQVYGTSNGVIATCGVTGAVNVVVLATATTLTQMRQFDVGMVIDIGTLAAPTVVAQARAITAIDRTNKTITISGTAVTTTGAHFVFRSGSGGDAANSTQRELTGFRTMIANTGAVFGVDPATQPAWKSVYDTNAGTPRAPTDLVFQAPMDNVSIEYGEEVDVLMTTFGVYRKYGSSLTNLKRFNDTITLKGGVKGLDITSGGKTATLLRDRDVPEQNGFGLNLDHIFMAVWGEGPDWLDEDGSILARVSNKLNYEATLFWLHELYVDARAAHFRIDDLSET